MKRKKSCHKRRRKDLLKRCQKAEDDTDDSSTSYNSRSMSHRGRSKQSSNRTRMEESASGNSVRSAISSTSTGCSDHAACAGSSGLKLTSHKSYDKTRNNHQRRKYRKRRRSRSRQQGDGREPADRETEVSEKSVTLSDEAEEDDNLEIPGFYYDRNQRKYFRIVPGQNNVQSGVVTRTTLTRATREAKRQRDLKELAKKSRPSQHTSPHPSKSNTNFCRLAANMQLGHCVDRTRCASYVRDITWRNLKPRGHLPIFPSPASPYEKLEHTKKMHLSRDKNKLLCLWTLSGTVAQRIQMLRLDNIDTADEERSVDFSVNPIGTVVLQSLSQVTNICWAPVNAGDINDNSVLYTTTTFLGNGLSLAMLRNLDSTTVDGFRHTEFNLGHQAAWTCAWNPHSAQFSVGSEKCGLLLDVETRKMWQLCSDNSDVLTQAFSSQSGGNMLYSGCRGGGVLAHDLRSTSTYPTLRLSHPSPVCHLHVSLNSPHVTAAQTNGQIVQWDTRIAKIVASYRGNVNEYSRLPFCVDERQRVLCCVGADGYTRLWCYQTGALLSTLPPPHPVSHDTVPCVVYTDQLMSELPTILLASLNQLHVYTL